jgi:hypothetical protein
MYYVSDSTVYGSLNAKSPTLPYSSLGSGK